MLAALACRYGYIEDIGDARGYTGGIVGFCSGTADMLALVTEYTRHKPDNGLATFLPALRTVDGSDSHAGLDPGFTTAWAAAAGDKVFLKTQEDERDRVYFGPTVILARTAACGRSGSPPTTTPRSFAACAGCGTSGPRRRRPRRRRGRAATRSPT
jgi:chitosanase